jgi:PAS domain S-box-containing protein
MVRISPWVAKTLSAYVVAAGVLGFLGWMLDIPRLADWDGDEITMQPNTTVASIATGLALLLVTLGRRKLAAYFAVLVLLIAGMTLFEHATGADLVIDRLLLFGRTWGGKATTAPGRMGIPGAVSWAIAATALISLRRLGKTPAVVSILGLMLCGIASLSLTGYMFGADMLYALPRLTAIAMQSATVLAAVGLALIVIAADRPPLRVILEDSAAGVLARRALPIVILLPVIIGYFCIRGNRAGLYDSSMAVALLVLLLIAALCGVLWWGVCAVALREESLRRSEERFSRFMQHLPGLAWIKDAEGRYLYVNESAAKAFQRHPHELIGKTDDAIFPAETAAQFKANDRDAVRSATGIQLIETLKQDDGVVHHSIVSKFPIPANDSGAPLVAGMAIDITERKRAEDTVNSLLTISELLNSTLDVEALLQILVREAIALVGAESGVSGLLTHDGMNCKNYLQKGKSLPLEYCWPPMHGLPGWLIVHKKPYLTNDAASDNQIVHALCEQFGVRSALSTPIISAQGNLLGFFEIHNKLDGRGFTAADQELLTAVSQVAAIAVQNALAYQALEEAKESLRAADRRKDEFLAVLAHELRNPLAPVRTGLEIFKQAGLNDELAKVQQAMERQIAHMVRLVDDLLDLSRISRDKLELRKQRVELATILRQAIETTQPLAVCSNQPIEIVLPDKPIYLDADPIRLAQVFANLLNNACKYSPPDQPIHVDAHREGSDAIVSIKDEGLGIPTDQLEQVFEMFTQVHQSFERTHRGLGIGLTLVRRLVQMHGGTVTANSAGPGRGSEFVVRLPVMVESPQASGKKWDLTAGQTISPRRVLVVDDNEDAAMTLAALMKIAGHQTVLAHDGEQACAISESYRPDIVLLDIGLPKMSGYDVCRFIRQQPWSSDAVIIALTGWGHDDDRRKSSAAGFDAHLVKPVDHGNLLSTLQSLLPIEA